MLYIDPTAKDLIIEDGITAFPDECCGFLFGKDEGDDRSITKALAVNNAKEGDKRRRFEITPVDYIRAEQYADDNGLTLLGIYHSHPNHPSLPSEHDRVAAQPFFSYVIVSINDAKYNTLQSWTLNEDFQFEEEKTKLLQLA